MAERAVRRVKEGTAAALVQSGSHHCWWVEAMETYCFLHNISDKLKDGRTARFNRFGKNFKGQQFPFGSKISFKPSAPKDLDSLPKFGGKTLPRIFAGYCLESGGALVR